MPVERVHALISLVIELSNADGERPEIVSDRDLQTREQENIEVLSESEINKRMSNKEVDDFVLEFWEKLST